jgi:hypothetical protein
MGQPLTTDNIDDSVRSALRVTTDDIIRRLDRVEQIVKEDLGFDRTQKNELPDGNIRLDQMYSRLDEFKNELVLMREEMKLIREQLVFLNQKMAEETKSLNPSTPLRAGSFQPSAFSLYPLPPTFSRMTIRRSDHLTISFPLT